MEKEHKTYHSSPTLLKKKYAKLFRRPFRYVIRADQVELNGQKNDDLFFYQTDIIVLFKTKLFQKKFLLEIFKKALQDMIVVLELNNTLLNIPFYVCHSYYIFTKNEERGTYSHFKNHGNEHDVYVTDTVQSIVGIDQLYESYIENYILQMNHIECAKRFFKDQFEHSNVIVDEISHIIFYIQPHDTRNAIKKKVFWQNESFDNYDDDDI